MAERVVLIAGATGPLGRAVAPALVERGDRVGLVGRDRGRLEALAADLELPDGRWHAAVADATDAGAAAAAVEAVAGRFGRIDVLIQAVGGYVDGSTVIETPAATLDLMLDRHLRATLNLARATVPAMLEAGWGRVIGFSSPVATTPIAKAGAYAVGKAAEETVLAALARELAGTGVTANVVVFRAIVSPDELAGGKRGTTPAAIVPAVLWLASDSSATVNGAKLALHLA